MKTAWFAEPKLKARVMEQLREHRRLDQIVQGKYWENGKGCNLGCLTHHNDNTHVAADRMFGLPQRVGYWLEAVFEGLPRESCAKWVIDSAEAIPIGADLTLVHHELTYWLLGPESPSAKGNADPSVSDVIARIRAMHDRCRNGETIDPAAWSAVRSAVRSAAESAVWSAVRSAAESAVWSAVRSAAESAAWQTIAAKSIDIFLACPTAECDDCGSCIESSMVYLDNNRTLIGAAR